MEIACSTHCLISLSDIDVNTALSPTHSFFPVKDSIGICIIISFPADCNFSTFSSELLENGITAAVKGTSNAIISSVPSPLYPKSSITIAT